MNDMILTYLLLLNAIMMLLLFMMWSTNTWLNKFLKMFLMVLFVANTVFYLMAIGCVVIK